MDRVTKTYLIGEATDEFAFQLGDHPFEACGDLSAAIAKAAANAKEGDVILLSPACASFDQFPSFETRGDAFRDAALKLIEAA
jgi:UDP-N-acetylmuramoylalanine--D-glutamate ligase